ARVDGAHAARLDRWVRAARLVSCRGRRDVCRPVGVDPKRRPGIERVDRSRTSCDLLYRPAHAWRRMPGGVCRDARCRIARATRVTRSRKITYGTIARINATTSASPT